MFCPFINKMMHNGKDHHFVQFEMCWHSIIYEESALFVAKSWSKVESEWSKVDIRF